MPATVKPLVLVLASALLAQLPLESVQAAREREIVDATISDLIERPREFAGKRVRVSGYLLIFAGVELLEPRWDRCYGQEEGRRYIVTDLTDAAARGEGQNGSMPLRDYANNGRMVTITGIFRNRSDPWPRSPMVESPHNPAVGPLRHARIERFGDTRCNAYIEPAH